MATNNKSAWERAKDFIRSKTQDNEGWIRQGSFTPGKQIQTIASNVNDDEGWYRQGKFTPLKQIGDFNPTGKMSLKESIAQLPQQAKSDWLDAGLVKDNQVLQKYAPGAIKPLSIATQLGPAAYMNAMSKGVSTFSRDTTGLQKAGDLIGVLGAMNPAYASRNLISGPLGAGFKAGTNLIEGKPLTDNLIEGWQSGQDFGFRSNVVSELTRPLTEFLTQSIPALNSLTQKAIEEGSKLPVNATFQQVFKTWLNTGAKKMLRAVIAETAAETPIYAALTKDDNGESYLEAIRRETVENLVMNAGFAGFENLFDPKFVGPLINESIGKAIKSVGSSIQNYKNKPMAETQGGYIKMFGDKVDKTQRTKRFDKAVFDLKENSEATPVEKSSAVDTIYQLAKETLKPEEYRKLIGKFSNYKEKGASLDKLIDVIGKRVKDEPFEIPNLLNLFGGDLESQRGAINLGAEIKIGKDSPTTKPGSESSESLPQTKGIRLKADSDGLKIKGDSGPVKINPEDLANEKQKLNVNRLNVSDESKLRIRKSQEGIKEDVLTFEEIREAAKTAGVDKTGPNKKHTLKKAAREFNARQVAVEAAVAYNKLAKAGASQKDLEIAMRDISKKAKIPTAQGTESARLMSARRMMAEKASSPKLRVMELFAKAGIELDTYIKDATKVNWENANEVVSLYRKYVPASFRDILTEYRYNNLLSSPKTMIGNIVGNVNQLLTQVPRKVVGGGLDWVYSGLSGKQRFRFASEAGPFTKGVLSSFPEAVDSMIQGLKGEKEIGNLDLKNVETGKLGILALPSRIAEGADRFFMTLASGGEEAALTKRYLKINKDIDPEALAKASKDYASQIMFRGQLFKEGQGWMLQALDSVTSAVLKLRHSKSKLVASSSRVFIPFVQTPMEILKQGIEYSPIELVNMIGSKGDTIDQLAKAMIGSTVMAGAGMMAVAGKTTWEEPQDTKERAHFYAQGKQAYSMKFGDKWVSYSKIGPLAYPIAMAAAIHKAIEDNKDDPNAILTAAKVVGMMGAFFTDQSYMQGMGDTLDAIRGDEYKQSRALSNIPKQHIPWSSFFSWVSRVVDPIYRRVDWSDGVPKAVVQSIQRDTPWLSKDLESYKTPTGQESERQYRIFNAFSPYLVTKESPGRLNTDNVISGPIPPSTTERNLVYKDALDKLSAYEDKKTRINYINDYDRDVKREIALEELEIDKVAAQTMVDMIEQQYPGEVYDFNLSTYGRDHSSNVRVEDRGAWAYEQLNKAESPEELQGWLNDMWDEGVFTTGDSGTAQYILDEYGIDVRRYTGTNNKIAKKIKSSLSSGGSGKISISRGSAPGVKKVQTARLKLGTQAASSPLKINLTQSSGGASRLAEVKKIVSQ